MKKAAFILLLGLISCNQSSKNNFREPTDTFVPPTSQELAEIAINNGSEALMRNPDNAVAYFGRGSGKNSLEDYEGAIIDFTAAIKINPAYFEAFCARGNSKYALKDYNGAIEDFTKAIQIDSNFSSPYLDRADTYVKLGLKDKACSDWRSVVEMGYPDFNDSIKKYN